MPFRQSIAAATPIVSASSSQLATAFSGPPGLPPWMTPSGSRSIGMYAPYEVMPTIRSSWRAETYDPGARTASSATGATDVDRPPSELCVNLGILSPPGSGIPSVSTAARGSYPRQRKEDSMDRLSRWLALALVPHALTPVLLTKIVSTPLRLGGATPPLDSL